MLGRFASRLCQQAGRLATASSILTATSSTATIRASTTARRMVVVTRHQTRHQPVGRAMTTAATSPTGAEAKKKSVGPLAVTYDPAAVEKEWYPFWEQSGLFKPFQPSKPSRQTASTPDVFSLVLPPPNVTGALHIGHALTVTVQDVLARWHRMRGRSVVWIPGLDHAGIATQSVVEKHLAASNPFVNGKRPLSRYDLGRDRFIERVWLWKDLYGTRITNQLRQVGASVDWTREVFTMDGRRSKAVAHAFITLYEAGLIYRSTRLVNWCSHLNTAISDIEVDTQEITARTKLSIPGKPEQYGLCGLCGCLGMCRSCD